MLLTEIAIVIALMVVNGLLAMSELAVVSARPVRLKALMAQGVKGAAPALALGSDPGRFLSTVQIGITLVGILAGAYSGTTLGRRLADWLLVLGMPEAVAEPVGFGLVVSVITYFSLIIGELVPKQIALRDPEGVACKVAPAMMGLARAAAPFVTLLHVSGKAVLALLGGGGPSPGRITEEEIKTLVAEAEGAGVLEPEERAMISGVMRLGDRPVRAVMSPRHEIDMVAVDDDIETVRRKLAESNHTRLPVYDAESDGVIGIIQAKDLLGKAGGDFHAMIRAAPMVPDSMHALDVVGLLKSSSAHLGLVHDEYGHFLGIVTSADILESIVGEFHTGEELVEQIVERPDGSLLIAGSMAADELADRLGILLPEDRSYHTAAGLVLAAFGHLPEVGETVVSHGWRFEIIDLDGRRIDKLLVSRVAALHRVRS